MVSALALVGCRDGGPGGEEDGGGTADDGGPDDGDVGDDDDDDDDPDSDSGDDGEPSACDDGIDVAIAPLRRLTREQYANAVRDLLALTADVEALDGDEKAGPFYANVTAPVSAVIVEQYRALAEDLAVEAVDQLDVIVPCDPVDSGCAEEFVETFGRRAYRRPLTDAEQSIYVDVMNEAERFDEGVRLVVQTMLQSPNFLYVVETSLPDPDADDVIALDGYELASRLSLFLWNSIPDPELLDAASAGMLDTPEGLREEALRMLDDTRARDAVASFHTQWLAIDHIEHATKDLGMFPFWSDEVRDAMIDETRRFSTGVVLQGDGRLETLLSADFTYIDGPLFEIYGIEEPPGHAIGDPVPLDPDERAGLLTQLGFLSAHAHPDQSGPIQRGVEVRTNLLCTPPPPPPPGINAIPPEFDPDATTREIFEMHTADPACAGCHELIDGIGLGFEGYDAIGAYRETQNGLPVDQTGTVIGTSDINGDFDGAVELAHMLATSEDVRSCVARQWFRYAFARIEDNEQDACSLETLDSVFAESDYNVRELMIALVQTDAFRYRLAD